MALIITTDPGDVERIWRFSASAENEAIGVLIMLPMYAVSPERQG